MEFPCLCSRLLTLLREQAEVGARSRIRRFIRFLVRRIFAYYLLRLEQLLAVRCGSMEACRRVFSAGGTRIIDGNIQQCLNLPQMCSGATAAGATLLAMKRARPDILSEFKDNWRCCKRKNRCTSRRRAWCNAWLARRWSA